MSQPASGMPTAESGSVVLFDADGPDRRLSIDEIDCERIEDNQLLWIDVSGTDDALARRVCAALRLEEAVADRLLAGNARPGLEVDGSVFCVHCVAVRHEGGLEFGGVLLNLLVGHNFVVTVHDDSVPYLDDLGSRLDTDNEVGAMSSESFTAAVLDWQLSTYFDAVADFEMAIERLEVGILGGSRHDLNELHALRKAASRLRRMLAPHRRVFAGLARPDFRPRATGEANVHFQTLDTHYERAMDAVENARDLVVGSFELFTSQTAWRTNRTMQALTFYTVLLGVMAVIVGALGMNFDAPLFRSGSAGFWKTIGGMLIVALAAVVFARRKRWL